MVDSIEVQPSHEPDAIPVPLNKRRGIYYPVYDLNPDSPSFDAFARLRVSMPKTLFDFKQNHNNSALFFDDQEVSGGGTSSSYRGNEASTRIGVSNATAGLRVRQTFMRFNYQPGKSHLVLMTGNLQVSGGGAGITRGFGYGDEKNGFFFYDNEGTPAIMKRSYITGAAVDTVIDQADWNVDPLDGTGPSGVTLDATKAQILMIDMEWLGVGRVRVGFVIDGIPYIAHEFLHSNVLATAYISNPNLPMRYWIENDGSGVASTLDHICCTVMSEAGEPDVGTNRSQATENSFIEATTANAYFAVFGIRLKSTDLDGIVTLKNIMLLDTGTQDYHWEIRRNPTLAGPAPSWTGISNSVVEYATGELVTDPSGTTVTGGEIIDSGYVKGGASAGVIYTETQSQLRPGAAIDGTPDEFWLICQPLQVNANIYGGLTWREVN